MVPSRDEILDEMLVLSAREGDRAAFQRLVERWQPRIFRHVRALVGREDSAWDVVQEVWIAVGKGLSKLADPGRFRRWLYTLATRRASDWQRGRGREEALVSLDETTPQPAHEDTEDPRLAALRRALARLPEERRTLLSLRYLEGFELWEIAEILTVPEGTVKSRLHHAREELRAIYERTER